MRPATADDLSHVDFQQGASIYRPIIEAALATPLGVIVTRGEDFPIAKTPQAIRAALTRAARDCFPDDDLRVSIRQRNADEYLVTVAGRQEASDA